jgi:Fic family protein
LFRHGSAFEDRRWLLTQLDHDSSAFWLSQSPVLLQGLHEIDMQAGASVVAPEAVTTRSTRDRYLLSSLMEEAITSSQMEGAATTRGVAKAMIRSRRPPRDRSERMILNNFLTMQRIRELRDQPLTPQLVLDLHRLVSENTLDDPADAGRLRPPGKEVVVRAIALHFWLAYDHPFCDGNGRTARALFDWALLHQGYWLFAFISISSVINKALGQYERSFLLSESDDTAMASAIRRPAVICRSWLPA